ncbi:leukosialin [Molossus molossus]|nr:leukosialin [Molossus molossus]
MSWSHLLLMPVVIEMTLLLLFFGGFWAQVVSTGPPEMTTSTEPSFSLVSNISEAPNLNAETSNHRIVMVPENNASTGQQISPPSSTPHSASESSSPKTFITAHGLPEPTISHEVSSRKSSVFQEIPKATSNSTVPATSTLVLHTITGGTMATSSLETSNETSRPPVTTATSSLAISDATSGPPVTMATSSLEISDATSGSPVTKATSSLEISDATSGPPVTMATSSLEISDATSGPPVTMVTSSLETPKGTSASPMSRVKIFIMTTPETPTNTGRTPSPNSDRRTTDTLMVTVLVALLVIIILLALLLLWRQRQKRRTGAVTLNRGGKRNGVVDAWAGPARVADEEVVITTAGVSDGDKGSGTPATENSGRRPTLTTFFGRRKSRQGSLALEEIKAGSAPSLKGEEEPLVGSEAGAVEAPNSDGPEGEI